MNGSATRPSLPALTSLRFFAALHVFMFHLYAIKIGTFSGLAGRIQLMGYVGVSLFFVLSGFILTYVHADREVRPTTFYRERFARIYPAYLFSLILTAPFFFYVCIKLKQMDIPFFAWFKYHVGTCAITVPTLTQSWIPRAALAWNSPAWSLSVEAFFYLLFPFFLPRVLRWSNRKLFGVAIACWAASLTMSSAYALLKPDGVQHVTDEALNLFWLNLIKFNPLVRFPEFVMGACCGVLYLRNWFQRRWASALVISGIVVFVAVAYASPHIPYPILHDGLLGPAFAALIIGLAMRPAWMKWMESKPLILFGNASYSLYLLHSFVLGAYFMANPNGIPSHGTFTGTLIGLLLPIVIAILVYRLIEEPLRRKLRPKARVLPPEPGALAQPA